MFVDMPPQPPTEIRYECPDVIKYRGRVDGGVGKNNQHYFGRQDGGYSVEIVRHGGQAVYTIIRACAGA